MRLASTWNPDLVHEVFTATAAETRARGGNYALSPVLDLARDPRWGRTEETYGEDPYLVSKIGVAAIRGLQGDRAARSIDSTSSPRPSTSRAHGQPEAGINAAPTNYAERDLREYFLAPFEAAVKDAHVQSVMAAYNEVNGIPVHVNTWLLRDVLRQRMGLRWFHHVRRVRHRRNWSPLHHVAADTAEAARKALQTGIDFELDNCFGTLIQQVRDGVMRRGADRSGGGARAARQVPVGLV